MTQDEASAAVFARWIARWPVECAAAGELATVPYSTDNTVQAEGPVFARVGLVSLDSEQRTIGRAKNRRIERPGFIDVKLSGPVREGRGRLDKLAGAVRRIYECRRFAARAGEHGITTHATSVSELRRDVDSPQLWLLTVTTPFEFYETI